jgi:dTDP-4-dehydrorhamnose 3,5-epimerase
MPITTRQTNLADVTLIQPSTFEDHRGTYVETYNVADYVANGITIDFVRDDISTSSKHVLRGIHYDNKTWKLIQCMFGRIYFVVVDMRPDSPQYLKWQSFVLSSENRTQILVPPGFGNGHLVLSNRCIFHYKMSAYYDPDNEKILRWDDPRVGVFWPVKDPQLSMKDSDAALLD